MVETNFSHHTFVISRAQLLPDKVRTLDMAPVTIVPWFVHPVGSLYQRLTTPGLVATLIGFSVRISSTNIRDIYAKASQSEVTLFNRFPASFVRTAAVYAKYLRDVDYHHNPGWTSYFFYILVIVTRLPLLPGRFLFQSYVSTYFQTDHDAPHIWQVHTKPWVSAKTDHLLPGAHHSVCPNDMSLFQLPPHADLLARYAVHSAELVVWLLFKTLGFFLVETIKHAAVWVPPVWSFVTYLLDIHWVSSPAGLLLTMLLYWYGLRGPRVRLPFFLRPPLLSWSKSVYARLFFLPSARLRFRAGLNWAYISCLNFSILCFTFPKFHPAVFYLDHVLRFERVVSPPVNLEPGFFNVSSFTGAPYVEQYQAIHYFGYHNVVRLCQVVNLLLCASFCVPYLFQVHRGYSPIHDTEAHGDLECCGDCMDDPSTTLSDAPVIPLCVDPPPQTPLPPSSLPDGDDFTSESPPITRPLTPIVPEEVAPLIVADPPPVVNNDPLWRYNLPPRTLENFDAWLNILWRLPPPANNLDPDNMCVWDVLGALFAVPAPTLWACYVSSLPAAQRGPHQTGALPNGDLPRVLNFFAVDYVVRATQHNTDVCPLQAQGYGTFDPSHPPLHQGKGLPGWPSLTAYLQYNEVDRTYHFSTRGRPQRNAGAPPAPDLWETIGWASRLVGAVEIGELVNLPNKGFGTVYRRLLGTMANPLSNFGAAPRIGNIILPAVPVVGQVVRYVPTGRDAGYARGLASDIKNKPSTLNIREFSEVDTARTIDQMAKQWHRFVTTGEGMVYPQVTFHLYHGAYGTGKSYQMGKDLAAVHRRTPFNSANLSFHTWDHDLREHFMADMLRDLPGVGLQPSNFMTGCMPLAQPRSGTLVLDDAGKSWNSFIPLVLACNPGITDVYVSFDACQAQGSFPTTAISRGHLSTSQWLSPMSDYYATNVVRTAPDVTAMYGLPQVAIPGRIVPRGQLIIVSQCPRDVPLLAVSPRFTQTQSMGGQVASTFTESQGHTIHGDVCIDLGGLTATATEHAAWTALTRATGNIYLCMGPDMKKPGIVETCFSKSQIISALLAVAVVRSTPYLTAAIDTDGLVRSACLSHMARCLSPAACARLGLPAASPIVGSRGVGSEHRAQWLAVRDRPSDVYTARAHRATLGGGKGASGPAFSRHSAQVTHFSSSPVAEIVRHYTPLASDAVLHATSTDYHLPAAVPLEVLPDPVDDINDPTDDVMRELSISTNPYNSTTQHIHDGAPDALHHTRSDKLTDVLGKRKRIRLGAHVNPWSSSDERRLGQLKRGFKKLFDVAAWDAEPFNEPLMEQCEQSKLASWASKRTKRALQASIAKQDIDAPFNFVKLFPKGQYIKKKAKWRSGAFPSQTISDFNLGRIFEDSPFALYLETQALRHAYDSTYLHCRASPDDVSNWYRRFWLPGVMTGNDYTAWDSGVDHVFIEFDLWLMQLCHFPSWYIQRFRENRLTTYSHLGVHAPRQESGDRYTWILNTLRNAALTGASLDFPNRTPACISGDDSVTLGAWRRSTGFVADDWLMKPKREEGTMMEFCGLVFGGPDVSFDPSVIHWRSRFGLQQGRSDADYWRSIRDAIAECTSKLGGSHRKLAAAKLNLDRAVSWFNLPSSLSIPDIPAPPPHPIDHVLSFRFCVRAVMSFVRFMCFL
jgi:hypothetical protein